MDDAASEESGSSAALNESNDPGGKGDGIGVVKSFNPRRTADVESILVSSMFADLRTSIS